MERENAVEMLWALLRNALNDTSDPPVLGALSDDNWREVIALARFNRVSALCSYAVAMLPQEQQPTRKIWLPWVAFQDIVEQKSRHKNSVAHELIAFLHQHGIDTMVLKGPRLAACYPHPELREYDDLDLYHFGHEKEVDSVVSIMLKQPVNTDDPHHSTYTFHGITVENHHTFHHNRHAPSNDDFEALLLRHVPSSTFDALYLLRHTASHFAASHATMRSLCDWAMFVQKKGAEVDWSTVGRAVHQYGMEYFVSAIQQIAIERLNAEEVIPVVKVDKEIVHRVENDFIYGEFPEPAHPQAGFKRALWKWQRYRANRWKRRLVYRDTEFVMLLHGIGDHLRSPHKITHKH